MATNSIYYSREEGKAWGGAELSRASFSASPGTFWPVTLSL